MSVHTGHRERLRARFLRDATALYDHELAELLLFYTARRRDVNGCAHLLCGEKGVAPLFCPNSGEGLLPPATEKSFSELSQLLCEFGRLYELDREDCLLGRRDLNSAECAKRFALGLAAEDNEEHVRLLCLDGKMGLKNCVLLPEKRLDGVAFERLYRAAARCSSEAVILVLTHTDGVCAFTREEIDRACSLFTAFSVTGIRLADVILCCDKTAAQFCTTGLFGREARI